MAVRIRVYPQNGLGMNGLGMNGLGMNGGGAVSASTYFNSRLQSQKQVSNLQLGYERALAGERIDKARLEERAKNPYAAIGTGMAGAYGGLGLPYGLGAGIPMGGIPMGGVPMGGVPMGGIPMGGIPMGGVPMGGVPMGGVPMGGVPMGGVPMGGLPMGGIPTGFGGAGQTNVTNQSSLGAGNQHVSNVNTSNNHHSISSPPLAGGWGGGWGGGAPGFGGGGLISGLLGWLV